MYLRHMYGKQTPDADGAAKYHPNPEREIILLRVLNHLRSMPSSDRRITSNFMNEFKISCGELDFKSAKPAKGNAFLELCPIAKFEQLAEMHAFHSIEQMYPELMGSNFHDSYHVAEQIKSYLYSCYELEYFTWRASWDFWVVPKLVLEKGLRHMKKTTAVMWRVETVLRYENDAFPHVNCVLEGTKTLKEDELLFSEVRCLLVLALTMLHERSNEVHKITPITIVSICAYEVRIVQGYVDFGTGNIVINKTPIVRLVEDGSVREDHFMTIVRWLVGTPVGRTT
ncbi:hypothetical protein NUW58_g5930 [Xylaria curta]|uniref:Uncharacterized protein n=1 Tax=Xylaria curta TaxID=42375 RepID=A0ACC1P0R2_9PEZI|nr:hypothetical protein NUW58_g5930 [Xylaria curta]